MPLVPLMLSLSIPFANITDSSQTLRRPCPFCELSVRDLRRHFITTHKNHVRVKRILDNEKNGSITKKDRILAFNKLKKEGIRSQNQLLICEKGASLQGERRCEGEKVMCSSCSGFFKKKYFYRHRQHCHNATKIAIKLPTTTTGCTTSTTGTDSEWAGVLDGMRQDETFDVVFADDVIQVIGSDIFAARKPNKKREAMVKARRAMRRVARLKNMLKVSSARELFCIENLRRLEAAINDMCTEEDELKAGLKLALGTLVKQCCAILIDFYATGGQKTLADEIRQFREVFCSPTHYAKLMATAEYQLKERRQRLNRKPDHLPDEGQLRVLNTYLERELGRITITSTRSFVHARKVALAHITLLNARRGSEAARLLVRDWRERHSWIDKSRLTEEDLALLKKYSVAFVMGKGSQLLPVFFPSMCEEVLEMLADYNIRQDAGVSASNEFLFAYTDASVEGAVGYNDIRDICREIGISTITATGMRHRASTALWGMDASDEQVNCFMEHIGHEKEMDKNVYACPPALRAMRIVTPLLERINTVSLINERWNVKG